MIVDEERETAEKGSKNGSAGLSPGTGKNVGSQINPMPSGGKRGASPTELLKKDKKGEVSLAKRPSMKRKASSAEGRATFNITAAGSLRAGSGATVAP
jgi:hypothetical protein